MTPIDNTSAGLGVPDEAQRQLLRFLRGLRGLDAALGRWRPDYGGLPAQADPDPLGGTDVVEAHRLYADGLTFFATHAGAAQSLGEPSNGDIAQAVADARLRFGTNAIPLERLAIITRQASAAPPPPLRESAKPVRGGKGHTPANGGKGAAPAKGSGGGGCALVAGIVAVLLIVGVTGGFIVAANTYLRGGPTAGTALPSATASPSASASPSGAAPNVLAQAQACATIPAGSLPSGLSVSSTSSGVGVDPETGFSTPDVSVELGTTLGPTTPRFTLILVILPFQDTASSSGSPVDRAGTVQVIAYWDGGAWHKGLRTWSGSAWSISVDAAATQVDVVQSGKTVTLYDQVLLSGDSYGEILAASGGCSDHDLDSSLSPQESYAG